MGRRWKLKTRWDCVGVVSFPSAGQALLVVSRLLELWSGPMELESTIVCVGYKDGMCRSSERLKIGLTTFENLKRRPTKRLNLLATLSFGYRRHLASA